MWKWLDFWCPCNVQHLGNLRSRGLLPPLPAFVKDQGRRPDSGHFLMMYAAAWVIANGRKHSCATRLFTVIWSLSKSSYTIDLCIICTAASLSTSGIGIMLETVKPAASFLFLDVNRMRPCSLWGRCERAQANISILVSYRRNTKHGWENTGVRASYTN